MSKKEEINPELFEIQLEYWKHYVIAYDMIHALQSLPIGLRNDIAVSVIQITGQGKGMMNHLSVAKECLPQGLVKKETTPPQ